MIKTIIHRLLAHRHFWRSVDFDEVAELYSATFIRNIAFNLFVPFIALYLLQHGMSPANVMLFMIVNFTFRIPAAFLCGWIVSRIGPKHGTLLSNVLYIPSAIVLTFVPGHMFAALALFIILQGMASTLYDISYTVDFSKVKRVEHAGKELGYMYIIQMIAAAASPLVGGLIAIILGANWIMYVAALLSLIAALPLFFTPEPVRTRQKISYRGINWKEIRKSLYAQSAVGIDMSASGTIWPVFIIAVIIGSITESTYAQIGALTSIAVVGALISGRIFGVIVDRNKGRPLLSLSVVLNSLLHMVRMWVPSINVAAGVNIVNQLFTSGYNMPFMKGMFDMADSLPGYRIAYLTLMEAMLTVGKVIPFVVAYVCLNILGLANGFAAVFIISGLLTLGIAVNGFRVLKQE